MDDVYYVLVCSLMFIGGMILSNLLHKIRPFDGAIIFSEEKNKIILDLYIDDYSLCDKRKKYIILKVKPLKIIEGDDNL